MTLDELKELKFLRKEIQQLDKAIEKLKKKEVPVVVGKVRGSSRNFPYTEVRTSVLMYEPETNDKLNRLIRLKLGQCDKMVSKAIEIEEFIQSIPDSETRQIFEMYFQEGMKQRDIAKKMNVERSTVSKKISTYLSFHTNHISE